MSYKAKTFRGMRTVRIRKTAAAAAALRCESPASRTLCYMIKRFSEFSMIVKDLIGQERVATE